jgi:glycosyltransferase involved in cell wall biosynthesis
MKLAVVIPWFGRHLKGGAEQQAWQIATRLAARGHHVEVLTTCCQSFQDDWATNHLPAGETSEPEGFTVHRFPVEPRDRASFDSVCANLSKVSRETLKPGVFPVPLEDARIFVNELIKSSALQQFLASQRERFDSFIFLPYLYGPIIHGIMAVGDRACLQPCLHDEAYAYLPQVAAAFYRARLLFFNSEGEAELAVRLFGPGIALKSVVVGEGVETRPPEALTDEVEEARLDRFVLYLGRKESGKNTDLLVRAFGRFRLVRPNSSLRLVLAGYGSVELNGSRDYITDLGLVSDAEKEQLLHDCLVVAQPSVNESFSRTMMEAWFHGKPVAVNSQCLATSTEARNADGGWIAGDEEDWAALFVEIDRAQPEELRRLGENGRRRAKLVADWDNVMDRYEHELKLMKPPSRGFRSIDVSAPLSIHQFLPNLSYGDAISNEAMSIRAYLRARGFHSEIYVRFIDPRVADHCSIFSPDALNASSAIIYHHSIGTEITPHVLNYHGPKCVIYHNITPAEFFESYRPAFAAILRQGREDLRKLAPHFDVAVGDSAFNAEELAQCGFRDPGVLSICVDPGKWNTSPDESLMRSLQDGRANLLFVGRIFPNKKQDDLVRAFRQYLDFDPNARLILVGTLEREDPYAEELHALIASSGLERSVTITGNISDSQLAAYYRTAHLFWSMSEHEGFCVPLIESMWFDVPVLAFRSSAVPETLGNAALMFADKADLRALAALAKIIVDDKTLQATLIRKQREQRRAFLPSKFEPQLIELVERLLRRHSIKSSGKRRTAPPPAVSSRRESSTPV